MSREAVMRKFVRLTAALRGPQKQRAIADSVAGLETIGVRDLMDTLVS